MLFLFTGGLLIRSVHDYNNTMSLETDLFRKLIPDPDKLLSYGFVREDGLYVCRQRFMDDRFLAEITVGGKEKIKGKVIDLDLEEEYALVHVPVRNSYAAEVRSAYLEILESIARECFVPGEFLTDQANRLASWIHERWGDRPDKPWKKDNGYTVIRNHDTSKWYGIIGEIPRNRFEPDAGEETVEVLNLKVPEDSMQACLAIKGIFPAFHMNKKNWVSVILDEDVSDEALQKLIEESRSFTVIRKSGLAEHDWLLPANPAIYDALGAFRANPLHYWPTRKKMSKGDTVYLYYAAPYSCLILRCTVIGHNAEGWTGLMVQEFYDKGQYPLNELKAHGLNTVRFVTRIPTELKTWLESTQGEIQ